jgi:hypothetical protein
MHLRNRLAVGAVVLALAAAPAAWAQVSSRPLAQVDAWGVGWIGSNEGALPATFWDSTSADTLAPLMAAIQAKDLSPAGRAALRRILLSRSKGPAGGDTLTPERLRLLEAIGETAHAVDLRQRYAATDWGKHGERLAAELDLLTGGHDTACATANAKPATNADWLPARALCAALKKNDGANLIAEQIARTDERFGVWLMGALSAINSTDIAKPEGRFTTPLEATISVAAKLPVPASAFAATSPDIAAAIALNKDATPEQRRAALRPALASSKLKPADAVAILALKDAAPAAKPTTRGAQPKPDYLALAITASADKEATPEAKAAAYVTALRSAETLADGRLIATALGAELKDLPRNEATLPFAEPIARAALLTGDTKLATDWRKHLGTVPMDKQDAWAAARLDLMLSLAGATHEQPAAILDRMLEAAPYPVTAANAVSTAKTPSTVEQQLTIRRIENTRALFMQVGTGHDLTITQRATLAAQRSAGRGVSDAAIARIASAARQNADAEAALAIIGQLGPDVSALSFAGLADLLTLLREIGMADDANAIALESLQVWKAL